MGSLGSLKNPSDRGTTPDPWARAYHATAVRWAPERMSPPFAVTPINHMKTAMATCPGGLSEVILACKSDVRGVVDGCLGVPAASAGGALFCLPSFVTSWPRQGCDRLLEPPNFGDSHESCWGVVGVQVGGRSSFGVRALNRIVAWVCRLC